MQPKIDWKRGWIDHTQLPVVLRTPDAAKAKFLPHTTNQPQPLRTPDRYFIGCVTIGTAAPATTTSLPSEYQQHAKIFSKAESQQLPQHTIWDHAIELLPNAPAMLPGRLLPLKQDEIMECHRFVEEHLR